MEAVILMVVFIVDLRKVAAELVGIIQQQLIAIMDLLEVEAEVEEEKVGRVEAQVMVVTGIS